jgi:SAM-dependent methyltransferase
MHDTALDHCDLFFKTYFNNPTGLKIIEIGAQDVNGSLRSITPAGNTYIGVDFVEGADVVLTDPYSLPFDSASIDVCLCSSCFEHSEFFWLLFNEIMRVLKPEGLFFLNAPSNGEFHRYPVDCWRFFPDSGVALQNWARRSGYNTLLLESFTGRTKTDMWNDFICVFLKDEAHLGGHNKRILDHFTSFTNGWKHGHEGFLNFTRDPQDREKYLAYSERLKAYEASFFGKLAKLFGAKF